MITFIARMIENASKHSVINGQNKYRAYFIKTDLYEEYRNDVNAILEVDGYSNSIVTE